MRNFLSSIVSDKKKLMLLGVPLVTLLVAGGGFLFVYLKTGKLPSASVFQKKVDIGLKTKYENPFAKTSQYVNPFESYKNPFIVSR